MRLQRLEPEGDFLEIGADSGAIAAELFASHQGVTLTATDHDREIVRIAAE